MGSKSEDYNYQFPRAIPCILASWAFLGYWGLDNFVLPCFILLQSFEKWGYIGGNLGSLMGLIRKWANNKFLWVWIQEPIEFQ